VQYAQELGRVGRLPDTDQVSPYLYAHAHVPTNDCRTPGDVSCTHIYSSLTSNTGRFLQLLRHLIWMHTARLGPVPLAPVDELAWVFDGVQVTLGKRNLYVCGRTHTQRPCHLSARQKSEVGFRDRLMIPAPLHRAALARLVRAGKKPVSRVHCNGVRLSKVQGKLTLQSSGKTASLALCISLPPSHYVFRTHCRSPVVP